MRLPAALLLVAEVTGTQKAAAFVRAAGITWVSATGNTAARERAVRFAHAGKTTATITTYRTIASRTRFLWIIEIPDAF